MTALPSVEMARADYRATHKTGIHSCRVYIKPEEQAAYYVINKVEGRWISPLLRCSNFKRVSCIPCCSRRLHYFCIFCLYGVVLPHLLPVDSVSIVCLPPVKIPFHFPFWNPDPGRFDFLHDGRQNLLVITGGCGLWPISSHTRRYSSNTHVLIFSFCLCFKFRNCLSI